MRSRPYATSAGGGEKHRNYRSINHFRRGVTICDVLFPWSPIIIEGRIPSGLNPLAQVIDPCADMRVCFLASPFALPARLLPAQVAGIGLLSEAVANRFGLERVWFTQIEVDRARGRVAFLTQHVNSTESYTVWEVQHDGRTVAFTDRTLDRSGNPIGKDGAEKLAQQTVEDANLALLGELDRVLSAAREKLAGDEQAVQKVDSLLKELTATPLQNLNRELLGAAQKLDGIPAAQQSVLDLNLAQRSPKLTTQVLPVIALYAMTDQGVLHALDAVRGARCGRRLWVRPSIRAKWQGPTIPTWQPSTVPIFSYWTTTAAR